MVELHGGTAVIVWGLKDQVEQTAPLANFRTTGVKRPQILWRRFVKDADS